MKINQFNMLLAATMILTPGFVEAAPPVVEKIPFMKTAGLTAVDLPKGSKNIRLQFSLMDAHGAFLNAGSIEVVVNGENKKLTVPRTSVMSYSVTREELKTFALIPPNDYNQLVQYSINAGSCFQNFPQLVRGKYPYPIESDSNYQKWMEAALRKEAQKKGNEHMEKIYSQLRSLAGSKARPSIPQPSDASGSALKQYSPEELYQYCRKRAVIIGSLHRGGKAISASGALISADGMFVTNYHVMDKPAKAWQAMVVMTADRKTYSIKRIVAASKAYDFAVVQLEGASGLPHASLSQGALPGTPVYMMAHPAGKMFSFHSGQITRYASYMNAGDLIHVAHVSTNYSPGASGGGIFNTHGEVVALVSVADPIGNYWTNYFGPPSSVIRQRLYLAE